MKKSKFTRREVLTASAGAIAALTMGFPFKTHGSARKYADKLAIKGGTPVRTKDWPSWPQWDPADDHKVIEVLHSGQWWRGNGGHVAEFEKQYAELIGSKRCLATASGTMALITSLHVMGVDAGDEVIVSPYTFIASYNVIFDRKALPVFADSDPETFLIDPDKIEEKITGRTKAILPVHIYGLPCDMDKINAIANKHNLVVIEDACQAWLSEYKNKKCGTLGDLGCFSFQNSKHIPTGEGGAITGNNDKIMDRCHSYHNCGRPYGSMITGGDNSIIGSNRRMAQYQAVMLLSQMKRALKDADTRWENAKYLESGLKEIPGIIPGKLVPGATRASYHLFPFRYSKEVFNNAPKARFLAALEAEGIPAVEGYGPQNKLALIDEALNSRGYQRLFPAERLKSYKDENSLPGNDKLCAEAVGLYQSILLGTKSDMDDIVKAIAKIYENRDQLI
ncbi:MAG TPA: DegT/DnrJ/EryC1/StrS family aminotransferase [Cyclobacteriaceae bacterium]|nr:DegT/DnrJ/EryC1/StrS family aminotransferase [Cyclobacteriaceae bacterium]